MCFCVDRVSTQRTYIRTTIPTPLPNPLHTHTPQNKTKKQVAFLTTGSSLLDSLFLCLYAHGPALTALCGATGVTRADPPEPPSPTQEGRKEESSRRRKPQAARAEAGPVVRGAYACGRIST